MPVRLAQVTEWLLDKYGIAEVSGPLLLSLLSPEKRWLIVDEFVDCGQVAWLGLFTKKNIDSSPFIAQRPAAHVLDPDARESGAQQLSSTNKKTKELHHLIRTGGAFAVLLETNADYVVNYRSMGDSQWLVDELFREFRIIPRHCGATTEVRLSTAWKNRWPAGSHLEPDAWQTIRILEAHAHSIGALPLHDENISRTAFRHLTSPGPGRSDLVKIWKRNPNRALLKTGETILGVSIQSKGLHSILFLLSSSPFWDEECHKLFFQKWIPLFDSLNITRIILHEISDETANTIQKHLTINGIHAKVNSKFGTVEITPTPLFTAPITNTLERCMN